MEHDGLRPSNAQRHFAVQAPMRRSACLLAAALSLSAAPLRSQAPSAPTVTVVSGSTADGRATDLWLAILRRRLSPAAYDSVAPLVRPRLPEEQAWAASIGARAQAWPTEVAPLARLFPGLPSRPVQVVLGNRGAEDAFTHDSLTIGFDLAALVRAYGPASGADTPERLDRFFRHEVVHTLQKRWLARHPFPVGGPMDMALLDIWLEGTGNYFSLSRRSYPGPDGNPAPLSARTLATLEPRFVGRMAALACADPAGALPLLADLSAGPFDQKWGALPAALWLLAEQGADSAALRRFVADGPTGVWQLAQRHLPAALADSLARTRERAAACSMTRRPAPPG